MIPEVAGLGADGRGILLGLWCAGGEAGAAARLEGTGASECRAAVTAVGALPSGARAAERAALAEELAADVPAGIGEVHPGWIRRILEPERSAVISAVVFGLPASIGRVADELLDARGHARRLDDDVAAGAPEGPGLVALRRVLFSALAPLPTSQAAGEGPALCRALCALPFASLVAEIDRRGAATLGLALAGAPDAVVARAAAGVGEPLADVLLAAARGESTAASRAEARADAASRADVRDAARAVGLRALARELAAEGGAALAAVAQRLPPSLGEALLACAPGAPRRAAP